MPTRAICMDAWFGHQAPPPPASLFRDKRTKMTPKKNNISSGSISLTTRQMCVRVTWNLHQQDGGSGGRPDTFFAIIISLPPAQFAVEINRHKMKKRKKKDDDGDSENRERFSPFLDSRDNGKGWMTKRIGSRRISRDSRPLPHQREYRSSKDEKTGQTQGTYTHTHTQVDALLFNRSLCNG